MSGRSSLSEFEREIIANVDHSGCHINMVFDPEGEDPGFAYSVGFTKTAGQPEVIVFGLGNDLMGSMINGCLDQCNAGLQLTDGTSIDGLLLNHPCVAREVHPSWFIIDYFNSAMWFHTTQLKRPFGCAIQLVWPDATNGLFPWNEGCGELAIAYQPALYETRINAE
jgi:hypothetical protein